MRKACISASSTESLARSVLSLAEIEAGPAGEGDARDWRRLFVKDAFRARTWAIGGENV